MQVQNCYCFSCFCFLPIETILVPSPLWLIKLTSQEDGHSESGVLLVLFSTRTTRSFKVLVSPSKGQSRRNSLPHQIAMFNKETTGLFAKKMTTQNGNKTCSKWPAVGEKFFLKTRANLVQQTIIW